MTKILHVTQQLTVGGAARALCGTAKFSARAGAFQHRVLSLLPPAKAGIQLAESCGLSVTTSLTGKALTDELSAADIVHLHFWNSPEIYRFLWSDLPPMRLVIWFHVSGDSVPQVLTRELLDFADMGLACNAHTYENTLLGTVRRESKRDNLGMVLASTDLEWLDGVERKAHSHFNVGYIGTIDFVKMHPAYVRMSAAVRVPEARFIVCGGGIEATLRKQAVELGAGDRFEFKGYVHNIKPILEQLDVYGYPLCEDTYAGSELNLQEVMLAGIPPVVFPYGGVKSLVKHNETGLVVSTEREYSEAIEHLFRHPEDRRRLGANARQYARDTFGSDKSALALNPIYQKMLSAPKRSRVWGHRADLPIHAQPIRLDDAVNDSSAVPGWLAFVRSLGEYGSAFKLSATGSDADEIFSADGQIAGASPLMRSSASGGILNYRLAYPNDGWLRFWSGLVLARAGEDKVAASEFVGALQAGVKHWRIQWYLSQVLTRLGQGEVAQKLIREVVAAAPDFAPAKLALEQAAGSTDAGPATTPSQPIPAGGTSMDATAKVQRLMESADAAFQNKDLVAARDFLIEAESLQPECVEVLICLGSVQHQLENFEGARDRFARATGLRPNDPSIHLQLAVANLKLERIDEFESAVARALQLDPNHYNSLKLIADLNLAQEQFPSAAEAYHKILTQKPDDIDCLLPLGVCFYRAGDRETAELVFKRVLEIQPGHPQALENLSVVQGASGGCAQPTSTPPRRKAKGLAELIEDANYFSEMGNQQGSLEALEEAVELAPSDPSLRSGLGSLYFTLGRFEAAREQFRRLIELRPREADGYLRLAIACLRLGRIDELESALGLALEIDPNHREALRFLAKTNLENSRVRDAGRVYAKLLDRDPQDLEAMLALALCFYRGGDQSSARMVYERVLLLAPGNEVALENLERLRSAPSPAITAVPKPVSPPLSQVPKHALELSARLAEAQAAFGAQNLAAARDALKAALDLAPSQPEILATAGAVCFQLGEMASARDYLQLAIQNGAGGADPHFQLAMALYQLGELEAFEKALGQSLEIDPNHLESLRLLAHLNFNQGSTVDAARIYGRILQQTPDDIETLMALGVCFYRKSDLPSAVMMFERVLSLDSTNSQAAGNLQAVRAKMNVAGAEPVPKVADQASIDAALAEAEAAMARKDLAAACRSLRRAAEEAKDSAEIWVTYGNILFQAGDNATSFQAFERATALRPNAADYWVRQALAAFKLGRHSDFDSALEKALTIAPTCAPALKLKAQGLFVRSDYKRAANTFHLLLKQQPDDTEVLLSMGICFFKTRDVAAAKMMFERVLELQPNHPLAKENLQTLQQSQSAPPRTECAGTPLVSAIVSTYNSERFLRGCLEDLEAQTIADRLEIIVLDSGSKQNERAIVEEFQRRYSNIVYIRSEERETVYGAWNRGVRAARGQYLTNANTDDRHRKDAFEILSAKLESNPGVAMVYADVWITEEENKTFETGRRIGKFEWHEFDREALVKKGCFLGPQPMWRKAVHETAGYFDASFVTAGDYEFWMKLAKTHEFLHVREILGLYLKSPDSVEHRNQIKAVTETQIARARHGEELLRKHASLREPVPNSNGAATEAAKPFRPAAKPRIEIPAAARVGGLEKAQDLLRRKKHLSAWNAVLEAMSLRPFHPDAYLQLIEISLDAGDERQAMICAQRLIELTPGWKMAKEVMASFRPSDQRRVTDIDWTPLPPRAERPRLSVCMIAKNEEENIGRCLASIKPIASQIVVVDTGSSDRTVEIAKAFGAETYYFPWNDNFSDARNAAHEYARGDWVLILDCDEELPAESHDALFRDMSATNVLGYRIPICNLHEDKDCVTYVPRLFRNAPALFFVGRVHEQIYASVIARRGEWGMNATLGTAKIVHHGYDPELVKRRQKVKRNLALLEKAIEEMPNECSLLMNYGLDLVNDGQMERGLEMYRRAMRVIEPISANYILPEVRERLVTLFGVHAMRAERFDEVLSVVTSKIARDAGPTASMSFMAGLSLMKLNRFEEAIPHLKHCLERRDGPVLTPPCHEIRGVAPHLLLAECYHRTGNPAAEAEFQLAIQFDPQSDAAPHEYALFLFLKERHVEGLQLIHAAMGRGVNTERLWHLGGHIANARPEFLEFALDWTAEAIKHFPEHAGIAQSRAECLLKSGQLAEALERFQKCERAQEPSFKAAILFCQAALGHSLDPVAPESEALTSREFISWYRRMLATRSEATIRAVNARVPALEERLPTAVRMLRQVLSEAAGKTA